MWDSNLRPVDRQASTLPTAPLRERRCDLLTPVTSRHDVSHNPSFQTWLTLLLCRNPLFELPHLCQPWPIKMRKSYGYSTERIYARLVCNLIEFYASPRPVCDGQHGERGESWSGGGLRLTISNEPPWWRDLLRLVILRFADFGTACPGLQAASCTGQTGMCVDTHQSRIDPRWKQPQKGHSWQVSWAFQTFQFSDIFTV